MTLDIAGKLKALGEKIRQRFFSKTYWAATALVALGTVQQYAGILTPFMPQAKMGAILASIGILMALLREYTNKALSEK